MQKLDLRNIRAVIFDMDGTMVDNTQYHRKAWQKFLKQYGMTISDEEYRENILGKSNKVLFPMVFKRGLTDESITYFAEEKEALYRNLYAEEIAAVSGLHELIDTLKQKGIKIAIATLASKKNRKLVLDSLGLNNTFDLITGYEHVKQGKPHPEVYLKTAARLEIQPYQCLVFEDSPSGVEAAKRAGMNVIGVLTSHTKEELQHVDMVIKDFRDVII